MVSATGQHAKATAQNSLPPKPGGKPKTTLNVPPIASLSGIAGQRRPEMAQVPVFQNATTDEFSRSNRARAYATASHIGLRAGEDARPGSDLLRHELVHVMQQRLGDRRDFLAQERDAEAGTLPSTRMGSAVPKTQFQNERAVTVTVRGQTMHVVTDAATNNRIRAIIEIPAPLVAGTYQMHFVGDQLVTRGYPNRSPLILFIPATSADRRRMVNALKRTTSSQPATLIIRPGSGGRAGSGSGSGTGSGTGSGGSGGGYTNRRRRRQAAASNRRQLAALRQGGHIPANQGQQLENQVASGQQLTPQQQQALLDALANGVVALTGQGQTPTGSAREMADFILRNQQILTNQVGQSSTALTLTEIEQTMQRHEQTVQGGAAAAAVAPLEESSMGTDPRFAALSQAERDLWRNYLEDYPSDRTTSDGGGLELTPDRLFNMALRMSPQHMPAGVAEALEETFRSPIFWGSIIVSIVIYLAMWLAPEPIISKSLAITITLALLAVFTAAEIIHLAQAWSQLRTDSTQITTYAELEAASARFGQAVGETGGRILIQLALLLAGGALPRPTAPPPGGFAPALVPAGGPRLAAATAPAIQITATGEVIAATTATLPSLAMMASNSGGSGGNGPPSSSSGSGSGSGSGSQSTGGSQTPPSRQSGSGTTPPAAAPPRTTPPSTTPPATAPPATSPPATAPPAVAPPTAPTAPNLPATTNRRLANLIQRIFTRAQGGNFNRSSGYHGQTRHQFSDQQVTQILRDPDAIYLSAGKSGRLIYRRGGDIVVLEGPGSGGGNAVTAYGPGGVRGTSGANALGGAPTDPGLAVTEAQIVGGTVPGQAIPPATKVWGRTP